MGNGRRLTTSRSERLLGSYCNNNGHDTSADDETELVEEDVWSTVDDHRKANNSEEEWTSRAFVDRDSRRRIPRDGSHVGGLSLAFEDSTAKTASSRIVHQSRNGGRDSMAVSSASSCRHVATSAPVNVPDWSKILRADSVESLHDLDDGLQERNTEMVPPHEYLAREYARSRKMGGPSVFEGVGRTLKGRDMRRVRDAVWSQTGFYG